MKKLKFVFLAIAVIPLSFYAQKPTKAPDTTYRPRTYQQQVAQFRSYPDKITDVIFLGNSITSRNHWEELLQMPRAKNRGISGDTTFGILERLDEITEGKPSKIFLLIGINDISRNFPDRTIIANYTEIINRIKEESPRTHIYVQTILPVNNTFDVYKNHYNKDEHILRVNNAIKKLAKKEGLTLIKLHDQFLDANNRLDPKYTEEGLHLNSVGYLLWADILKPYLAD